MWRAFFVIVLAGFAFGQPVLAADRPPQFITMAFDNCTELERWRELTDFAAAMNASGKNLHFTFFVSGVNFIADLYRHGHEIASHAVGHFSGRNWSAADWAKELQSFRDVLAKVGPDNGLGSDVKFAFPPSAVIGFRAPYLDSSPGLYAALRNDGFRYDTSGDSKPDAWPEKIDGLWRFNLVELKLHDSSKHLLSMDYNFFVTQAHGKVDPQRRQFFEEQVLQTYLDYFRANYTGNRAPLHIGHHFFDYEDGAYREALEAFARTVCGLPEVRCASYAELTDFLDRQSPHTLEAYRNGDFPHAAAPALSVAGLEERSLHHD